MASFEPCVPQPLGLAGSAVKHCCGRVLDGPANEMSLDNRVLYDTDPAATVRRVERSHKLTHPQGSGV